MTTGIPFLLMDPSHANSRQRSRQVIDAQIKVVEAYARSLKLRRNALLPVSSLPPEIFVAIFSMLCLPGTSSLDGKPDHHIARLCVSHVCHQWREIALDQSLLWSFVNFTALSSAGAAEILVRAKSAPLYLQASLSGNCPDDVRFSTFRKELLSRTTHIHGLKIVAGHKLLNQTVGEIVSFAPTLEYLSLSCRRKNQYSIIISDTLFNGCTPRLSSLKLSYCDISWKSPLLKGLKYLKIIMHNTTDRPGLEVWLGALEEMPQLVTLTLHSASPIAPFIPFDVERMVTLSSLTHLNILGRLADCTLAVAHLDLPALTSLCLTTFSSYLPKDSNLEKLLPHVARHAHGLQDTRPLQSAVISCNNFHVNILAWPVPDIDLEVHDPPTLLAMTRVALSFRSNIWISVKDRLNVPEVVMAGLSLNGLVTLATNNEKISHDELHLTIRFWPHLSPKFPILQRVRLSPLATYGFIVMLLQDDGGRERPLLPSLKELTVVNFSLSALSEYPVYDALRKRVELGVPMEKLDLRMCTKNSFSGAEAWCLSLTEFVDVLGPEKAFNEREYTWNTLARGPFVNSSEEDDDSNSGSDEEE